MHPLYHRHSVGFPEHWATYNLEQRLSDQFYQRFFGDRPGIKVNTVWGTSQVMVPEWASEELRNSQQCPSKIDLVIDTLKHNAGIECVLFYEFADQIEPEWQSAVKIVQQMLGDDNVKVIGNTLGAQPCWHYYPFWLRACKELFKSYTPEELTPKGFQNLFLSYNRKPAGHRLNSYKILKDHNLLQHGVFTLGAQPGEHSTVSFSDNKPPEYMQMADDDSVYGITADAFTLGNPDVWNSSFLIIVHETLCDQVTTLPLLTEKSFKPIVGMRPFVVYGQKHSVKILQDLGFSTFEDVFGDNPVDVVKTCVNSDLHALYQKLLPRIQHNRDLYLNLGPSDYDLDCVDTQSYT